MAVVSAYISLLTLLQLLETLKLRYKYKLNSVDPERIEDLEGQALYFLEFLESRPPGPDDPRMEQIALDIRDSVIAASEVLDRHLVNQILRAEDVTDEDDKWPSAASTEDMIKVIQDLESVRCKVTTAGCNLESTPVSQRSLKSNRSTSFTKNCLPKVVGFESHLSWMKDERIASHVKSLVVIPIVGMGGIGKTTLARLVYEDRLIQRRFERSYWVTVSREYDLLRILQGVLGDEDEGCDSVRDLGTNLYQSLKGFRYLIVLDDMWDLKAWEALKQYLPDDNQGSRVIVTTRDQKLAAGLESSKAYNVKFLDPDKSWELFCDRVFGGMCCPTELEAFGRKIVKNCRGHPLAITTIAGLLSKSDKTCEYWSSVSKDVASLVNLEDNEYSRKVLSLSYDYLPLRLKPLFLYIGGFYEEDAWIGSPDLIRAVLAFALVRPIQGKRIEEAALEYTIELIHTNLIFIRKWEEIWQFMHLRIHDLLRDHCLKEISTRKLFSDLVGRCTKCTLNSKGSCYLVRDFQLCGSCRKSDKSEEASSLGSALWNMQKFDDTQATGMEFLVSEIWSWPQLSSLVLWTNSFPVNERKLPTVFERLRKIKSDVCTREMADAMPNLKHLTLCDSRDLKNVALPSQLETLYWGNARGIEHVSFPESLKVLYLGDCRISCSQVNGFGALPNLEALEVSNYSSKYLGRVWTPIEGGFLRLKFLKLDRLCEYWRKGSDIHFPQLEILEVWGLHEIPRGLKNIDTLTEIELTDCHNDVVERAKWILKQRRSGNYQLSLTIDLEDQEEEEDDGGDDEEEEEEDDEEEEEEEDDEEEEEEEEDKRSSRLLWVKWGLVSLRETVRRRIWKNHRIRVSQYRAMRKLWISYSPENCPCTSRESV